MKFDNAEQQVAAEIKKTADELNDLMEVADALGLTVSITPTKIERRGKEPLRQIMAKVSVELSISEDKRKDDVGNAQQQQRRQR